MIIDGYSAEDINNNAMNQYILKRNSELIDRKVIEDIKAEIERGSKLLCVGSFEKGIAKGLKVALEIIDKHIGDTE